MIISIHQPQYLPWLPYFAKISRADIFVFLDNVQFQKNGLQNRNELKNSQGRFWLTIPVSSSLGDRLSEVKIESSIWSKKHIKSIYLNYHNSVNFDFFTKHIQDIIEKNDNLVDLNIEIIEKICRFYFNIDTKLYRQSNLNVSGKGSGLILDICRKLGAKKYLSGIGGKNYINVNEFKDSGIEVDYLENTLPEEYPQLYKKVGFINDISALDFVLNVKSGWESYSIL